MSTPISDYTTAAANDITTRINFLKAKTDPYTALEQVEIVMSIDQLQERIDTNPANLLEVSNSELNTVKNEIEQLKKDLKIAEDRVATLRHPEKDRSYYESWFPINRPLAHKSIIIILALGIFFFVLSFLIIMKSIGFHINLSMPWNNSESLVKVSSFLPPMIVNNLNKIVIGLLIIFITLYATKA